MYSKNNNDKKYINHVNHDISNTNLANTEECFYKLILTDLLCELSLGSYQLLPSVKVVDFAGEQARTHER